MKRQPTSFMKFKYIALLIFVAVFITHCGNSEQQDAFSPEERQKYQSKGKEIAEATFGAMSQALKTHLAKGGVQQAVKYCNVAALPLADSLAQVHQVIIKRASLKPRNEIDTPDSLEQKILEKYEALHQKSAPMQPSLTRLDKNKVLFNAPIVMKPLCLNCHGTVGKEINAKDYELIKTLYPQDKAVGYKEGDLRGMWSILFYQEL